MTDLVGLWVLCWCSELCALLVQMGSSPRICEAHLWFCWFSRDDTRNDLKPHFLERISRVVGGSILTASRSLLQAVTAWIGVQLFFPLKLFPTFSLLGFFFSFAPSPHNKNNTKSHHHSHKLPENYLKDLYYFITQSKLFPISLYFLSSD